MSESDLVARTRHEIESAIARALCAQEESCDASGGERWWSLSTDAVAELAAAAAVNALPALLADNERLAAQVEAGRKINDQLMQSSASDSRMILRLQGEVRAAVARADAAEARLTQLVENVRYECKEIQRTHRMQGDYCCSYCSGDYPCEPYLVAGRLLVASRPIAAASVVSETGETDA